MPDVDVDVDERDESYDESGVDDDGDEEITKRSQLPINTTEKQRGNIPDIDERDESNNDIEVDGMIL